MLRMMPYALCLMHYALCIIFYALCLMPYALFLMPCLLPLYAAEQDNARGGAVHEGTSG